MMWKKETGVMLMKDGKAWGVEYEDGHCTCYGWIDPIDAPIYSEDFYKKPSDMCEGRDHYLNEVNKGKIVHVEKRTELVVIE